MPVTKSLFTVNTLVMTPRKVLKLQEEPIKASSIFKPRWKSLNQAIEVELVAPVVVRQSRSRRVIKTPARYTYA